MPSALVQFAPAVVVAAVWTAWTAADGGYFPSVWYPSAIAVCALLVMLVAVGERRLPASRSLRLGLALLGGFVLLSYLSMLWSASPGNALEESNRLLLLLAAVACVALLPWNERTATVLLAAWTLGVAAVMAIDLIGTASAGEEVKDHFITGRYLGPLGYPNASTAACAMALCSALLLSARRELWAPLQVCFVAVGVFLLEYSLLPQSRAGVVGLVAAALIALALAPDRLRLLGRLLIVGVFTALAAGAVFDVYSVAIDIYNGRGGRLAPAIDDAVSAIWPTVVGAAAAAVLLVSAERLIGRYRSFVRYIRLVAAGMAIVAALAGAVIALANAGRIYDGVHDRFAGSGSDSVDTGPRITAKFADKRSDYWRVAVDVFADHPVIGAGAGTYGDEYTKRRDQSFTHNKYAHNLVLRALVDAGAVGGLLLTGAIAALIAGLLAAWRRLEGAARSVSAIAATVLGYFLVHSLLDWLELFPALAAPALSLPVVALAVGSRASADSSSAARPWLAPAVVTAGAVAVIVLALPYLADRYVDRASKSARSDPDQALVDLDRASSLNPLSVQPLLRKGTLAVSLGRMTLARETYREALDVEDGWYAHFELAAIAAGEGRFRIATEEIRKARALNPRDPFVLEVRAKILRRRRIDPAALHRKIAKANRARFTTGGG